ncbi:MAG TPA: Uma2 family endonuclease [Gemmataceae bacterium]|nr:Uma2 family endonuclease [Gemmataceae bacterium]
MLMPVESPRKKASGLLPLANGDRMSQPEFHRRYKAYPEGVKIELIGGVVYMASPMRMPHSRYDSELGNPFITYRKRTPVVEELRGATTILGRKSEPQPDLGLRILTEFGGTSHIDVEEYIVGPPELLGEIAYSTRAMDLYQKRDDYRKAGVAEYIVLCVEEKRLRWLDFKGRCEIEPDDQGVFRSRVFPGLWIDGPALLARDTRAVEKVIRRGLRSPEHADFVRRLMRAKRLGDTP